MLGELSISSAEGKRPTRRAPYDQLAVPRRGAGVAEQGCLLSTKVPIFNNLQDLPRFAIMYFNPLCFKHLRRFSCLHEVSAGTSE
jgi:hypothetical protein